MGKSKNIKTVGTINNLNKLEQYKLSWNKTYIYYWHDLKCLRIMKYLCKKLLVQIISNTYVQLERLLERLGKTNENVKKGDIS